LARWLGSAWEIYTPKPGWLVGVGTDILSFTGTGWQSLAAVVAANPALASLFVQRLITGEAYLPPVAGKGGELIVAGGGANSNWSLDSVGGTLRINHASPAFTALSIDSLGRIATPSQPVCHSLWNYNPAVGTDIVMAGGAGRGGLVWSSGSTCLIPTSGWYKFSVTTLRPGGLQLGMFIMLNGVPAMASVDQTPTTDFSNFSMSDAFPCVAGDYVSLRVTLGTTHSDAGFNRFCAQFLG
jgi:hypothetical protein